MKLRFFIHLILYSSFLLGDSFAYKVRLSKCRVFHVASMLADMHLVESPKTNSFGSRSYSNLQYQNNSFLIDLGSDSIDSAMLSDISSNNLNKAFYIEMTGGFPRITNSIYQWVIPGKYTQPYYITWFTGEDIVLRVTYGTNKYYYAIQWIVHNCQNIIDVHNIWWYEPWNGWKNPNNDIYTVSDCVNMMEKREHHRQPVL